MWVYVVMSLIFFSVSAMDLVQVIYAIVLDKPFIHVLLNSLAAAFMASAGSVNAARFIVEHEKRKKVAAE